ncbi:CLUMA_CG016977, isoform A [Clunio marinus]|uniref:CLUMA_CG016977, isoform A n=1 Tax=Clunio marinus TaxID=568069 RepID=A0A1J1IUI6_9DIPT|nr:CLUMA_CG016977, isoform A [Clunio marinus]
MCQEFGYLFQQKIFYGDFIMVAFIYLNFNIFDLKCLATCAFGNLEHFKNLNTLEKFHFREMLLAAFSFQV